MANLAQNGYCLRCSSKNFRALVCNSFVAPLFINIFLRHCHTNMHTNNVISYHCDTYNYYECTRPSR